MSVDFVRCYIGDISILTLQSVLEECSRFSEWELIPSSGFNHEKSYGYIGFSDRDEQLIKAYIKRSSVIAETKQPEKSKPSLIWDNALLIVDVLTLLSIARTKDYHPLLVEKKLGNKYSLGFGRVSSLIEGARDIVRINELEQFISRALDFIEQNATWMKSTGFIPSIWWFIQIQQMFRTVPTILEIALYWVSLEIVASTYLRNNTINIRGKEQKVRRFIEDKGYTGQDWRFLSEVIKDCYAIRCGAFHEGIEPNFPLGTMSVRRAQVRELASLVLVEMLQPQGEERRKLIAERMQSY